MLGLSRQSDSALRRIADKHELKGDIARVQEQVNSIEAELKYGRYEKRPGDLEEEVFGEPRS